MRYLRTIITFIVGSFLSVGTPGHAQDMATLQSPVTGSSQVINIQLIGCVTWWSHDAVGYHPAVVFTYENVGNRDLTGETIKFQARFTDLRNGYVTVARKTIREDEFLPNQQKHLQLTGPSSFELPIDPSTWPQLECKVMARVGDVDDTGTENLVLTSVEPVVMTDEGAQDQLARKYDIAHHESRHRHARSVGPNTPAESKPLSATQLSLNSPAKPVKPAHPDLHKTYLDKFLAQPNLAGLGDNFLQFETTYRQQPSRADEEFSNHWKWIRYTHEDPTMTVYDGTRTSSADVLVIKIHADELQSESQIAPLVKAMSGKFKGQPVDHFKKAVSYRPNGLRVEVSTADTSGYHAVYFNPTKEDSNYIIVLSRLPGNPKVVLPELFRRTQMLNFLTPLFGEPEQD